MKIKLLHKNAKVPTKAYQGDAGFDIYSIKDVNIYSHSVEQIKLGIAIEIEEDEVCIMSERSGMAINNGITSIGNVIDSGYRGECSIILRTSNSEFIAKKGDKIGQMLILKLGNQKLEVVDNLSKSERDKKAHNSSGV